MKFCDNCGSKLDDQQKFCPNCGKSLNANVVQTVNKNSSEFSILRVFAGVVVAIVLIVGFVIYRANIDDIYGDSDDYDYSDSVDNSSAKEPDYVLTSGELIKEYKENAISADNKYKGKIVEVTGKIDSIDKDILNDEYISLSGDDGIFDYIQCYIAKSDISKISNYKVGDSITIVGKVDDYNLDLSMKNGKIK